MVWVPEHVPGPTARVRQLGRDAVAAAIDSYEKARIYSALADVDAGQGQVLAAKTAAKVADLAAQEAHVWASAAREVLGDTAETGHALGLAREARQHADSAIGRAEAAAALATRRTA